MVIKPRVKNRLKRNDTIHNNRKHRKPNLPAKYKKKQQSAHVSAIKMTK